jgi:hypothetical protein
MNSFEEKRDCDRCRHKASLLSSEAAPEDGMAFQNKQKVRWLMILFKLVAVFMIGSIIMHLIVMVLDYFLLTKPVYLNLRENFYDSIFSVAMLPMMVVYGLFSIASYTMWARMKKAMLLAHAEEIKSEKVEADLKSMQRITGMLAEQIAKHNAEIMNWIESRKINGNPVSAKLEKSCNNIANALHSLSEISFIIAYSDNRPDDVADIEKILGDKLLETKEVQMINVINK